MKPQAIQLAKFQQEQRMARHVDAHNLALQALIQMLGENPDVFKDSPNKEHVMLLYKRLNPEPKKEEPKKEEPKPTEEVKK